MSLKETIETEYKNALKSKDKSKISTYRLILSSIKDLDISNRSGPNKKETDDEDIKKLFKKMAKQRAESIDIYKKNNRTDLLEIEQNEYNILTSFLPKQLGDEETKKICAELISKLEASSVKDMGKVMGELKKLHSEEIDFAKAGSLIKEPAFAKSISSECNFFNSPITLPTSLTELAPNLEINSAHIFFVSSSPSCFGKKLVKI